MFLETSLYAIDKMFINDTEGMNVEQSRAGKTGAGLELIQFKRCKEECQKMLIIRQNNDNG